MRNCKSRTISFDAVLDRIIETLNNMVDDFEVKVENGADAATELYEKELNSVKQALDDCEIQQERLFAFLESGTYDENTFRRRNALLAEKRALLQSEYEELLSNAPAAVSYEEMVGSNGR